MITRHLEEMYFFRMLSKGLPGHKTSVLRHNVIKKNCCPSVQLNTVGKEQCVGLKYRMLRTQFIVLINKKSINGGLH
jgi:hypothetical protein